MVEKRLTLAALRVRAGYTQEQAASILKISKPTLVRWESDSRNLQLHNLGDLKKLYCFALEDLYLGRASRLAEKIQSAYKKCI